MGQGQAADSKFQVEISSTRNLWLVFNILIRQLICLLVPLLCLLVLLIGSESIKTGKVKRGGLPSSFIINNNGQSHNLAKLSQEVLSPYCEAYHSTTPNQRYKQKLQILISFHLTIKGVGLTYHSQKISTTKQDSFCLQQKSKE